MTSTGKSAAKRARECAMLLRATAGRNGLLLLPTDIDELLVAGDLHGRVDTLKKILELADLAHHPRRHLVLQEFVHGKQRYEVGGCRSHRLLDVICALKSQFPQRVHLLLGNHELSEWTGRAIAKNGESLSELFIEGVANAYGADFEEVLAGYDELFSAMPIALKTPNRVFLSHSLPSLRRQESFDVRLFESRSIDAESANADSDIHALLWGRDTSEAAVAGFLRMVDADFLITGHIACAEGFTFPSERQLIVDCSGDPAAVCLFRTDLPMTRAILEAGVKVL